MVDLEYGFLCVRYEVTGFGHNDHGSYPTGVWHIDLCATSETAELAVVQGGISEAPAADIARALTVVAAEGWRAEETIQVAQLFHNWKFENLLIRVARASAADS